MPRPPRAHLSSSAVVPGRGSVWARRRAFAEAAVWLTAYGLGVSVLPSRRISGLLRLDKARCPVTEARGGDPERLAEVRWAIAAAARRLPWRPVCLPQALAARRLLVRRGLDATLYLGVRCGCDATAGMVAHAWVECAGEIVVGGDGAGFTVLARFS